MGVHVPSPPEGGKVVFELLLVREWLDAHLERFSSMAIETFFKDAARLPLDPKEMVRWAESYRRVLKNDVYQNSYPLCIPMPWAPELHRKKLYLGVYNRLCMLHAHPVWQTLSDAERVEHAWCIAWRAHIRCATIRSLLYGGLPVPFEAPYALLDAAKVRHEVEVGLIPVTSYGRRDL